MRFASPVGPVVRREDVDAGQHGGLDCLLKAVVVADGTHLQVVGDDDAVIAKLFAQQTRDDGP